MLIKFEFKFVRKMENQFTRSSNIILDGRKSYNLEFEREKVLKKKEDLIKKFELQYIYDSRRKPKSSIKIKNYIDGSRYEGQVTKDRRNGKGIYHYSNGDKYIGDWEDDKFHGIGVYIFANGERYEGEL